MRPSEKKFSSDEKTCTACALRYFDAKRHDGFLNSTRTLPLTAEYMYRLRPDYEMTRAMKNILENIEQAKAIMLMIQNT
jgi:hypothetical protein